MFRAIAILLSVVIAPEVCAQSKEGDKLKKPARFKIVRLGDPVAYLGNYCGTTEMPKTELLAADSLKIKYCFNLPSDYNIIRYKFSGIVAGQYYSFVVKGARITREIKNVLAKVTRDTKIKFTGIIASKKDSVKKNFDNLVIKITDVKDTSLITYKLKNKIPEPELFSVKQQLPQKVSRLQLMFVDQLIVKCDCAIPSFSTHFRVLNFNLKTTVNGDKRIYTANGSDLTEEMREALQKAKTGTRFHLENIRVKTDSGVVGYLSPRSFKVINP